MLPRLPWIIFYFAKKAAIRWGDKTPPDNCLSQCLVFTIIVFVAGTFAVINNDAILGTRIRGRSHGF